MLIRALGLPTWMLRRRHYFSREAVVGSRKKDPQSRPSASSWLYFRKYFEAKGRKVEEECEEVIDEMMKGESLDVWRVIRLIDGYMRSHGDEFYQDNTRTPQGLIKLLTAVHLRR